MLGKPQFYTGRGTFSLRVSEIRAVGIGELLARIERLRQLLDAEGLFDPRLKRPIPFLPGTIGLITGRASAAERDVDRGGPEPLARGAVRGSQHGRAGAQRRAADRRRAARAGRRPGRRRDRAGPRRRQRRGPAAVLRRDAVPGDRQRAPRRWSAPSATSRTTRCAIWSPTCARPRRPTPPSGSCPTPRPSRRWSRDLRRRSARALRNWVHREQHTA